LKNNSDDRKAVLARARESYERFLERLDDYNILSKSDKKLYSTYLEGRDAFSVASSSDAAARRSTKIARFREEKELKKKLQVRYVHVLALNLAKHRPVH
jgi:hypothetical protein